MGFEVAHAAPLHAADPSNRVIDERNAFLMDSMLKGVVRFGTGAHAGAVLNRADIAGKTGTTNDARRRLVRWLCQWRRGGRHLGRLRPAAVAWQSRVRRRRCLANLDLVHAIGLKGVPQTERPVPQGISNVGGEYYYSEFLPAQDAPPSGNPTRPCPIPTKSGELAGRCVTLRPTICASQHNISGSERFRAGRPNPGACVFRIDTFCNSASSSATHLSAATAFPLCLSQITPRLFP